MSERNEHIAAAKGLVHDVGKYISRAACNLRDKTLITSLLGMLIDDLYCTDGTRRASALFERLAEPLSRSVDAQPYLIRCRKMLRRIDELEERVRLGDESSVMEASGNATAVNETLRAMLNVLNGRSAQ